MAVLKKIPSAQELSEQIAQINEKMGYGQEALAASPTAYTADVRPTGSDLFSEINLRKLQNQRDVLQSQLLQKKWYGEGRAPEETGGKRKEGLLEGALNMLSRPLYAVVGGVEAATGKGTVPGWSNIQKNIEEKGTFGDLFRREGMSGGVAAPLGFVMDVAFDPVNWMTAGTGALLPRIGVGIAKAGVKGGLKGAESGLLQKAALVSRILPGKKGVKTGTSGIIPEVMEKEGENIAQKLGKGYTKTKGAYSSGIRGLQERAIQSSEEYNKLIGNELEKILDEKKGLMAQYVGFGDIARGAIEKLPHGTSLLKAFDYNPKEWFRVQMLRDQLEEAEKKKGTFLGETFDPITNKKIVPTAEDVKRTTMAVELEPFENILPKNPLGERVQNFQAEKLNDVINEAADASKAPMNVMREADSLTRAEKMLAEAGVDYDVKDLIKVLNERVSKFQDKKTQIEWYDNLRKAANELKVLNGKPYVKKVLDVYDAAIGFFKASKVSALSPSAMMNAAVGNLAMAGMAGLNVLRPQLMGMVKDSFMFLNGRGSKKFLEKYIDSNPILRPFFASHVNTFGGVMGMTPMDFVNRVNMETIINTAKEKGLDFTPEQVQSTLFKANNEIRQTPFQLSQKLRRGEGVMAEPTTFTAQELGSNEAYLRFKDWAARNAEDNPVAKVLDFIMTKPVSAYERIDQSYRLGNFLHMVNNGLEREEITKLARFIPIEGKDLVNKYKEGGRMLYKMTPEKALEAVNMIYMNYAAMPGAVKIMRSLPILGAPFACVDTETEILTGYGWKKYYEAHCGDLALSFNINKKIFEWKVITNVNIFNYDRNDTVKMNSRSLDLIMTSNHRCVVARRPNLELQKDKSGKRVRGKKEWECSFVEASMLKKISEKYSVVVGAENGCDTPLVECVTDDIVELVGWYVTEGYLTYKRRNGGYSGFTISQAKPDGVKRIQELRKRLNISSNIQVSKKEKVKMANFDCYNFYFPFNYKLIMDKFAPEKQLCVEFLRILTKKQLRILFDVMILADGSVTKSGRMVFTQNDNDTLKSFLVLCLMLGYSCTVLKKPKTKNCFSVDVNTKLYRQIKRNKPKNIRYSGLVWCPTVADNETWVAKRNGKISVTGNSFSYGMGAKTIETAMYNPAIFNKINFLLNEISGPKTPLEKETMARGYYENYGQPGMVKLPFFRENPLYLNVANMLPYLSLNLFGEEGRKYGSRFPDKMAATIENMPLLKDPVGQVIFDYVIQPTLVKDVSPQSQFGTPLYPFDASAAQKAGYAGRQIMEAFVPTGPAAVAGVAAGFTSLPENAIEMTPSYRFRSLARAVRGEDPFGQKRKEHPAARTTRGLFSTAGLPISQMNLDYMAKELTKKKK